MAEYDAKLKLMDQDRKLQFEQSSQKIKQNKDQVQTLRRENKELKQTLGSLSKALEGVNDQAIRDGELGKLDDKVGKLRRRYDDLKSLTARKGLELKRQQEQLNALEAEAEPLLTDASPLMKKIRLLENRLDKSMIKFNEAQSIRKTYEQIVKRLQEERIGFDNQLAAIERTLKAKEHDYKELLNMSHDASHAKEISKAELAQFRAAYEEERRQKDRELAERKAYVQSRIEQTQRMEKREKTRRAQEIENMERQREEKRKLDGLAALQNSTNEQLDEQERERLAHLEEMVEKIKEAAGVATAHEIVNKFLAQEDTHRNLLQVTKEAQAKIALLALKKTELKNKVEDLKWTSGGQIGSRRIVEEFEVHLAEKREEFEQSKTQFEKVARLFMGVKGGVEHLYDLLSSVKLDAQLNVITDDNVVEALKHCENKLLMLNEELTGGNGNELPEISSLGIDPSDLNLIELPHNNRRVRTGADQQDDESDASEDEEEEDVLDRPMVKKLAALAVAREAKKAKKRGKRNNKEGDN